MVNCFILSTKKLNSTERDGDEGRNGKKIRHTSREMQAAVNTEQKIIQL